MKPGYLTSEFWLCLLAAVLPVVEPLIHTGQGASFGATILAGIFTLARAYLKANQPAPQPSPPQNVTPIS
jgi:hypothetical protein